jgi:hypothetical protein
MSRKPTPSRAKKRRYPVEVGDFVPALPQLDPLLYFETTGDGCRKTEALLRDLRALPPSPEVEEALAGAERLLAHLVAIRKDFVHLETDWERDPDTGRRVLWVRQVNPRPRKNPYRAQD